MCGQASSRSVRASCLALPPQQSSSQLTAGIQDHQHVADTFNHHPGSTWFTLSTLLDQLHITHSDHESSVRHQRTFLWRPPPLPLTMSLCLSISLRVFGSVVVCTDEIHDPEADSWCSGVAAMDSIGRFCQSRYTPRAGSVGMVLVLACPCSCCRWMPRICVCGGGVVSHGSSRDRLVVCGSS